MSPPLDPGFPTGLLVEIDRSQGAGIRRQLETKLRRDVQDGRLAPGTKLPPSRTLARELGVARSVIVEVYGQLVAEGFVEAAQGAGTRVRALPAAVPNERSQAAGKRLNTAFASGLPEPAFFPARAWLRAYGSIFGASASQPLGSPDPRGRLELRTALAGYLSRVRSLRSCPSQLLICDGVSQVLAIVAGALRTLGVTRIGVEDPCFAPHRRLLAGHGMQIVAIPVDCHGLDICALHETDVDAVLVGPAHSFPSGAVLSRARRDELVAWARNRDGLVIEDDYDAEYRFLGSPLGALQSLAPEHVLYTGSVSKVLDPALRIGWVAAPQRLAADLLGAKLIANAATATFAQLALAQFTEDGGLARHIRRVRPRYRARRDRLLSELAVQAPELRPRGLEVGLHLFLPLPANVGEADVIAAAKQDGLLLEGATRHWSNAGAAVPALVLGYGTLNESAVARDVRTLVAAINSAGSGQLQTRTAA